jgi:riboflavin-specific deaminase-like protein
VPFITLTYAQSLDGSIARAKGIPTAISGNLSLKMTHRLRELHRGILVGVDTLISDNPSLTVRYREEDAVHPDVIIVDSNLRIPLGSKVVENIEKDRRRVLVAYANENVSGKRMEEIQRKGVELVLCKSDDCGRVDLEDMFWKLHEKRIPSIMIEGGASIIHSLLTNQKYAKHLNQIVITISPQFV